MNIENILAELARDLECSVDEARMYALVLVDYQTDLARGNQARIEEYAKRVPEKLRNNFFRTARLTQIVLGMLPPKADTSVN